MRRRQKMNRYVLQLEDGTCVKVRAVRPPTWAAAGTHMMPQYRYTGQVLQGLGRVQEADYSLPRVPETTVILFEMRRHAKEAVMNERWIQRWVSTPFYTSQLNLRQLLRVTDCQLVENGTVAPKVPEAVAYTRREVERQQERLQA